MNKPRLSQVSTQRSKPVSSSVSLPVSAAFSRRQALQYGGCALACLATQHAWAQDPSKARVLVDDTGFALVEARYYSTLDGKRVRCELCPRRCQVADMERGYCGVRENHQGIYYTLVHSRVCSANTDPLEKKPLFHVVPGANAFSLATAGCNMECKFCQNWEISQYRPEQIPARKLSPAQVHNEAKAQAAPFIAYTYTEPVVFYEYMYDCAQLGSSSGIRSVVISNGFIEPKPLQELLPLITAFKVDLKAFSNDFYRDLCAARLQPVLQTLQLIKKSDCWLEIVVLILPEHNDSEREISALASFIKRNLGADTPLHLTRFHPSYRLTKLPPTPVTTLERCYDVARAQGLQFVYLGNVRGHRGENTYCPSCEHLLVERRGFTVLNNQLVNGCCPNCKRRIPGVWT